MLSSPVTPAASPTWKNILIVVLTLTLAISLLIRQPWTAAPVKSVSGPPDGSPATGALADRFASVVSALTEAAGNPGLLGSALGFCLIDSSGTVVVDFHAGTAFIPASTLKTVTTATALQRLGPGFRIETRLYGTAPVTDGILDGDLVIAGGADPLLSLEDLSEWTVILAHLGLREVTGRIIGDGSLFQGSLFDDFWNWGDVGNGYGSAVSGLNLEHNRFEVTLRGAARPGEPAAVASLTPEIPSVRIVNEVTTGPPDSDDQVVIYGGERTGLITLRGTVPAEAQTSVTGAVPDPEVFAAYHLRLALQKACIAVKGEAIARHSLTDWPAPTAYDLWIHLSPPLLDLITSIHATSDNHETECLFRLLGLMAQQNPETVVRDHWKSRGLEFIGLRMEDGCGLARADHIRPLDLARLQFLTARGPCGQDYQASLLAEGPLRWKGGAMSSIRTCTGYITSRQSGEFSFALMANHYSDAQAVSKLRHQLIGLVSAL